MHQQMAFGEVLEAVDGLSAEEQETLVDILSRRVAERGRKQLAIEVGEARQEFAAGGCRPTTPDALMSELLQ
jgi:hypothetical protein